MAKKSILIRSRIKRVQSLVEQGKDPEALDLLRQLVHQDRANPDIWLMLGIIHGRGGNPAEAEACLRKAMRLRGTHVPTLYNLGIAIRDQGRPAEALPLFERVVSLAPQYVDAHDNIAHCHLALGDLEQAAASFRKAIGIFPRKAELWSNLGSVQQARGHLTEAENCYRKALELDPQMATAYDSLGSALTGQGRFEEALECYRESLRRHPRNARAYSNYLLTLNYLAEIDDQALFDAHREWGRRFDRSVSRMTESTSSRNGSKRIRVGFVSSDLRRHSVSHFFEPLLEACDRDRFEFICYASLPREDEVTERLKRLAAAWRDITAMNDIDAARIIRDDGIDILIDLNGHTAGNRLGIFVERPAPVQVTWLGYPNTTGLEAIDYRIVDELTDPPGREAFHTESLLRLPGCFLCYRHPDDAPEVALPPMLENGYVTFGSFNNLAKINSEVIRLWSRVIEAVPESRLLIKNPSLTDEKTRERYYALFEEAGLPRDRVELLGHTPTPSEHLALYSRVDVALDTFPYNGTTTTCEALWMGVPVVTLAGGRHAARVGLSLLTAAGHPEWVAEDDEQYVVIAAGLAANPKQLAALRAGLRRALEASTLCGAQGFAARMGAALEDMCRREVTGQAEAES